MSVEIRRARPLLGTFVEICASASSEGVAVVAIEEAFEEISAIHRLMSFQSADSDLARLNRADANEPVCIDRRTREVLALSLAFARESDGLFDPTVAAELVEWGVLPWPAGATRRPGRDVSWRDVELLRDGRVRLTRPLWLDFGGIAKGYAVDRAIARLARAGVTAASVNAGGDLRLTGPKSQTVHLRPATTMIVPALELREGSVATSSGIALRKRLHNRWSGPHVDGRRRCATGTHEAASVIAARCVVADALTKVVLADPEGARRLLRKHHARACVFDSRHGWWMVEA